VYELIALAILAAYIYLALLIGRRVYRASQKRSLQVLVSTLLICLPFYDLIIAYFVFEQFSRQHPGVSVTTKYEISGLVVEGRVVRKPLDGLYSPFSVALQYYEYSRDMVSVKTLASKEPLRAYVQFRIVAPTDSTCVEPLHEGGSRNAPIAGCIGVSSTDAPISRFALLEEPDRRLAPDGLLRDTSRFVPIAYTHSRVRDLQSGALVAEVWGFGVPPWWGTPDFAWYTRQNPGGLSAKSALRPSK
jgi:hypothetical protein